MCRILSALATDEINRARVHWANRQSALHADREHRAAERSKNGATVAVRDALRSHQKKPSKVNGAGKIGGCREGYASAAA